MNIYEHMRVLKVKVISLPYIFQALYGLCFTRPRYQVSVYRTIGLLVFQCYNENFILTGILLMIGAMVETLVVRVLDFGAEGHRFETN